MKRNPAALVIALLVFIGAVFIFLQTTPDGDATSYATTADRTPGREMEQAGATSEPPHSAPPDADEARRLSPPSWKPPAVFAVAGSPAPQKPFPRGENAQRRHPAPETRDLPRNLRSRTPAVLAMTPEDGRTHLLPEEIDLHTRTARRMVLDPAALDHIVAGNTSRMLAPTSGDEVLTLEFHSVKNRSAQSHTLLGRVLGEEQTSDVQLVYHDGVIHGTIARYAAAIDQHLEYRILADGHMVVRELDPATMTAVCGNGPDTVGDELFDGLPDDGFEIIPHDDGEISGDTPGWRTIDVVVGYDQGARAADGGYSQIEARIISSVDRMSTAFANSLIGDTELMLLGTIEDPDYVFPGEIAGSMGSSDELGKLNNFSDGHLDAVSNYYTLLGADLICFVTRQADGSAGVAYRPGRASIVARDYMTANRITFAHELGHNLGCDHSWGDTSQAYHSHYGWRLDPPESTRVRTIMAYDWGWGNRIPYFANPTVSFNGAATGAVGGYNVLGVLSADQRYYQGGLGYSSSDPDRYGFDGNNPGLAATNANTIHTGGGNSNYGATRASNRATRTSFNVASPLSGVEWLCGETGSILFTGGDMQNLATIQLFKGGVLHSTLATNLNPATHRNFTWNIPEGLMPGADYMVRVILNFGSGGSATADSGFFSIISTTPQIIAHTPAADTPVNGPVSQIAIAFSQEMDPGSFSIGDDILSFTGPQGLVLTPAITGASWSNGNTVLTIHFPAQSFAGYYRMAIGPEIADIDGNPLDQNQNEITGEPIDDRYIAALQISGSGSVETIWSDMIGTDPPDAGWTFSGTNSSWQIGTPTSNPSTSYDGSPIIGQNLAGNYNVLENSFAESPVIDCGAHTNVTVSFRGWKGAGRFDELYIDVWNGASWQRVYTYTGPNGGASDNSWMLYQPSLAGHADLNPDFKLRWGLVDVTTGNSGTQTGWQLDAIAVEGSSPPEPLPAPWVTAHWPDDTRETPQSSIWLDFSQPMDVLSFGLDDIDSFAGPSGSITATGFGWLDSTTLRIDFPIQFASGQYTLVLAPTVLDELGRPLDQNFNGTPGGTGDHYTATFSISSETTSNPLAEGGDITLVDGHYIHTFTQGGNDTFQVVGGGPLEVDVLVIGGGGGGGSSTAFGMAGGGGGGAGGLVYQTGLQVSGTTDVVAGYGGAGGGTGNTPASNGANSSFGTLVALGGGGGSGGNVAGLAGGSGGGGRGASGGAGLQPTSSSGGFGNVGGAWPSAGGDGAGGGGGAGAPAPSSPPHDPKVGGPGGGGRAYDISGTMAHYAGGGGGGGAQSSAFGPGGHGGGGNGGNDGNAPVPGIAETGGGGGGGNNNRTGASGGSGIVILRYEAPSSSSTPYDDWTVGEFVNPFIDTDPNADPDGDGLTNLQEFAFGTDPTIGSPGPIEYVAGGGVSKPGSPIAESIATGDGVDHFAVFGRRKDHVFTGLTYTVQFSADLDTWVVSTEPPSVLTDENDDGVIEAVSVPFPLLIPVNDGHQKPAFFRVGVSMN